MSAQAKRIIVRGRVQGVGFRYFVEHAGSRLGLVGSVRNLPDGGVEIYVEGDAALIQEFLNDVSRGPTLARVERMEVQEVSPSGRYRTFEIEGW